jgi:putative resolvase
VSRRWFKAGKLPVPARQLPSGTILVEEPSPGGRAVLYARVSSADGRADLERQVERLRAFAQAQGWQDFEVVAEIGSGLSGKHRKLLRVLKDPTVGRIVVEHRDRLARFGFEMVEAAPKAEGEVKDDLVRDLLKVLIRNGQVAIFAGFRGPKRAHVQVTPESPVLRGPWPGSPSSPRRGRPQPPWSAWGPSPKRTATSPVVRLYRAKSSARKAPSRSRGTRSWAILPAGVMRSRV